MISEDVTGRVATLQRSARARRLRARLPRYVLWAFLAITSLVGVRELLAPREAASQPEVPVAADAGAQGYALAFARAYLGYDAAHPVERERRLRGLLPSDLQPDAGLEPRAGSREVLWAEIADTERSEGGWTITVAAETDRDAGPLHLAVPIERSPEGLLRLRGYPALVGAPPVSEAELPELPEVEDRELAATARRVIANYLAGEQTNLEADLAPDAAVSLPPEPLALHAVEGVAWAGRPGSSPVAITVDAADSAGATYTLTYELGIEERRGRPYVSFIETLPTTPKEG